MEKKNKNKLRDRCSVCGMPLNDQRVIRCPRCNTVLLKLVSCSGSCLSCQVQNSCTSDR